MDLTSRNLSTVRGFSVDMDGTFFFLVTGCSIFGRITFLLMFWR